MRIHSLRSQIIVGVAIVIAMFVAVQMTIRAFVIYPQLKSLSEKHDKYELLRVASEIHQEIRALENLVYDNAVWDESYRALETKDVAWFEKTYFSAASYSTLGIHGWFFFDSNKNLVAGEHFSATYPLDDISRQIVQSGLLDEIHHTEDSIVHTLFELIDGKPAALIASHILPSDEQGESNGTAIIVQQINQAFIDKITPNIEGDIQFHSTDSLSQDAITNSILFGALINKKLDLLEFESSLNRLYVRFESPTKTSLFAISIQRPKGPDKHIIMDGSLIGGIVVSVLSLIVYYGFINRKLITPVYDLLQLVQRAQTEQDFSVRSELEGSNEVYQLGKRLNNLLALIQAQQSAVSEKNKILQNLSRTDALTGLSNRRYFDEWMASLSSNANTPSIAVSLLIIDIDYFKLFNDHYGHAKGDEALTLVATAIKQSLHESTDHAFRYGGEEFVVVLQDTDSEEAVKVAENIRQHIENKHCEHNTSPLSDYITISIGVATKQVNMLLDVQNIFKLADQALYTAKARGRNRVAFQSDSETI